MFHKYREGEKRKDTYIYIYIYFDRRQLAELVALCDFSLNPAIHNYDDYVVETTAEGDISWNSETLSYMLNSLSLLPALPVGFVML